jgi:hypothetical protein
MRNCLRRLLLVFCLSGCCLHTTIAAQERSGCAVVGIVFDIDLQRRSLMLKDKTGFIGKVDVPAQVEVSKLGVGDAASRPGRITFADIHQNDLVCIEGDPGDKQFTRISVVARSDSQRAQREVALLWQSSSVFGSILLIDRETRKMVVSPQIMHYPPPPTQINLPPDVQYRSYPPTALRIADASPIAFEDLQQGDTVYVRGKGGAGEPNLQAALVLKGGMRAILGTLLEVNGSSVRLQEFGTGRDLSIAIPSSMAYRTTRELTKAGGTIKFDESKLAMVRFSDLQPGDTVLVLGSTNSNTNTWTGLGIISQFGHFGSVPTDTGHQLSWFLTK